MGFQASEKVSFTRNNSFPCFHAFKSHVPLKDSGKKKRNLLYFTTVIKNSFWIFQQFSFGDCWWLFKLISGTVNFISSYLTIKKYIKVIVNICRWKEINVELYQLLYKNFFIHECDTLFCNSLSSYTITSSFLPCMRAFFN